MEDDSSPFNTFGKVLSEYLERDGGRPEKI